MDYIELLKDVDYFSFIIAIAKWMFIFLVISIMVLVIGTKLKLFKRRTKVAKVLVKLYYILIPLYFMLFAIKYAPIKNSQIEINKVIDENKEIATEFVHDFVGAVASEALLTQETSAKDLVNSYLDTYVYKADSLPQPEDLNIGKRFIYKIKREIEFNYLIVVKESKIIKEAVNLVGIDEQTGKDLYRTDFKNLFSEGEIVDIFKKQLNRTYRSIYKSMFILFLIGLLIPGIEIVLARIYKY